MTSMLPTIHGDVETIFSRDNLNTPKQSRPLNCDHTTIHPPQLKESFSVGRQGTLEQHINERRNVLRAQLPLLSHWETTAYKNSHKRNLCIDMLVQGFHKSFTELFGLVKRQSKDRIIAGLDSLLWNKKPISEEHEKLNQLRTHLVDAEKALLKGDYNSIYKNHHTLAEYFHDTDDKWLADHFFQNCLQVANFISNDDGKVTADGHCNVGISLEQAGRYDAAANHFELVYSLTRNKNDWFMADRKTLMFTNACNNLARIYTTIAECSKAQEGQRTSLTFFQKAYDMATEGGDQTLCGEASYRLGVAHEQNGDPQTALQELHSYLKYCQLVKDNAGIGKVCEAISRAYDSIGRVEESIKYRQMFIQVSEDSQDEAAISRACNSLGTQLNALGQYNQAVEYFNKSYNIARRQNNAEMVGNSRVLYGVAQAHKILRYYSLHMDASNESCTDTLMEWKNNRVDSFYKPGPNQDIGPQGLGILHNRVQENTHPDEEQKRTKMAMVDI